MSWLMAAVYDRFMQGAERACGDAWRSELLSDLRGDVLEIGAGTGRNLDHYREVGRLVLAEPDPHMRRKLSSKLATVSGSASFEIVAWEAERLAAGDASFDAVVCTLVLCSVRDTTRSLEEIRRVLKPEGKLVFLEHVASESPGSRVWQRRVEPLWKRVAGNCHLCRDTATLMERAGFQFDSISHESAPKTLPIVRSMIRGVASVPRVTSTPGS